MKISYNWLKTFIDTDISVDELTQILTDIGLEVEGFEEKEEIKGGLRDVVVGKVETVSQHPNADRLKLTKVNVGGGELLSIVCGAPNVAAGQKVIVAQVGAELYPNGGDEALKIKKSKIRGEVSEGMLCAEDELGVGVSHDGIMVLNEDATIGETASSFFQLKTDTLIEIGLTPNRADAMSHMGVARDVAAYLEIHNRPVKFNIPEVQFWKFGTNNKLKATIENTDAAPKYLLALIEGLTVKESPAWLQSHLRSIGLQPINNVVDITNYVLHGIGQPLHAFDANVVNGNVTVKTGLGGTKFKALDEVEYELHDDDLMICNDDGGMCIAGVYGGIDSGVSEKTTSVVLESAYFDPVFTRKAAKRHGMHTDASFRFERGIDPNITEYALWYACNLISEICGGKVEGDAISIISKSFEPFKVLFNPDKCRSLLGDDIPNDFMLKVFKSLEIEVADNSGEDWTLLVPAYRNDVIREADVCEEILRMYGYNNVRIPSKLNATTANFPKKNKHQVYNSISNTLSALGYSEMMNNSLGKDYKTDEKLQVRMLNPLSQDLAVMRQSLLYGALEVVAYNQNRQHPDLKLYEFGKAYFSENGEYVEKEQLILINAGKSADNTWHGARKSDFFEIKAHLELIFNKANIRFSQAISQHQDLEKGLVYRLGEKELARIGTVGKEDKKKFGVKVDTVVAIVDMDLLFRKLKLELKYSPVSKFPFVKRDLSILVDNNVDFQTIVDIAKKTEKSILQDVQLFDVYEGDKLPENKKSYACSFILQDKNKTLTDSKVDKVMSLLINKYKEELEAELR